jgi:hypothetical protein
VIELTALEREILQFMAEEGTKNVSFTITEGSAYMVGSGIEIPMRQLESLVEKLLVGLVSAKFIRGAPAGQPTQVMTMRITQLGRDALAGGKARE